jgi:ATP-dependent Clp protease protease subunit
MSQIIFPDDLVWMKGQLYSSFNQAAMGGMMQQQMPATQAYMPQIRVETANGVRMEDPISALYDNRTIFLNGQVEDNMAQVIVAQLLQLDATPVKGDKSTDITLLINSPGGVVTAGMAIYDTMNDISCDVSTLCMGQAASMGAFLLSAGAPGKRIALPSARVMIHQPSGGFQGQATDFKIHYDEIQRMKDELNGLMGKHCGKSRQELQDNTERDNFMSSQEAADFGLIDKVRHPKAAAPASKAATLKP